MKFTIGADPEVFLRDAAGSFVSAINKIGGSKKEPRPLPIGEGFAVQEDNVALEYNIPPARDIVEFNRNISMAMDYLSNLVAGMGLQFSEESAVSFPKSQLRHPAAMEFGCDPDFNAWLDGETNPRPRAKDKTLRTCGGHVHIGYEFNAASEVIELVKHIDLATIGAVIMDKGEKRKELYGAPGAFRFKPFGLEYRSLSNFWIFKQETREWVVRSVERAMDMWLNKEVDINAERDMILSTINKNNKEQARQLVNKYNLLVC